MKVTYNNSNNINPEYSTIESRKTYLLKACFNLLHKQIDSHYVLDMLTETVEYDGVECDGYCLLQDIADTLYEESLVKGYEDSIIENKEIALEPDNYDSYYNLII